MTTSSLTCCSSHPDRSLRRNRAESLKVQAEHLSQLIFYVLVANEEMKLPRQRPAVGILMSRSKNEHTVRYALDGAAKPLAAASYTYDALPKAEQQQLHKAGYRPFSGTSRSSVEEHASPVQSGGRRKWSKIVDPSAPGSASHAPIPLATSLRPSSTSSRNAGISIRV